MAIEYNKDLHIELLRDELILTREELEKKYITHNAFREIVNEVHSTVRMDELKGRSQAIIETILCLNAYALLVWGSTEKKFIIARSKNMKDKDKKEALRVLEQLATRPGEELLESELVYLPLNEGKAVFGALCMPADVHRQAVRGKGEIMQLATGQLTKAIENSVLYESARKLALTDDKTLLFNHRYLVNRLDFEIKRATRYNRELALLMIDIDDFKDFNNAYGHMKGDDVLSEMAGLIKRTCRDIDIVARFGGEEFTVVLPETDKYGAEPVASRVLEAVKRYRFTTGRGFDASLTISIGIASYPEHAKYATEVLELADRALYRAKKAGKDRFEVATRPAVNGESKS